MSLCYFLFEQGFHVFCKMLPIPKVAADDLKSTDVFSKCIAAPTTCTTQCSTVSSTEACLPPSADLESLTLGSSEK